MNGLLVSDRMMELIARRFRTLGEPLRLRLLQILESGEKTVGELIEGTAASQSNVSKHLGILHEAGLVSRRREGVSVVYAIADPMIFRLCDLVCRSETRKLERNIKELTATSVKGRAR